MASVVGPLDEQMILAYLAPYRPRTRENYGLVLREWMRWCAAARVPLLAVERVHIEAWSRHQARIGWTDNTVRTKLVPIAGLYRWAHQERRIERNPAEHIRRPTAPAASSRDWLTSDELNRALTYAHGADPQARAILHLGALNGLRLGEMLAINTSDRTHRAGRPALHIRHRKAGTGDVVTLTDETDETVSLLVRSRSGPILRGAKGGRLHEDTARVLLDDLIRGAGIDRRITPQCLRVTFITLALEAGIDPRIVADSAGQKSLQTTYYYNRQRNATIHNATHQLNAWLADNNDDPGGDGWH